MEAEIEKRLIELNHQFYQTFASPFSATRRRIQPGVHRILDRIPPGGRLLDLGCGNGELYRSLARISPPRHYVGVDFSPGLLEDAAQGAHAIWLELDLTGDDWSAIHAHAPFDVALAFAVLHHLPGYALRRDVLRRVRECLAPGGQLIHSEWQFLNSPRLRERIRPWELAGLSADQVDDGDFLLDWRSGGSGLRYVHHFSREELAALADETGFNIVETFTSDGAGGDLSLYQFWNART